MIGTDGSQIAAPARKPTARQQRFVDEYIIDLNGTQAAIRAGYAKGSASVQGTRLLRNDSVQYAIALAQQQRAERTAITQDRVLNELAILGFADMGDYIRLEPDGSARMDWSSLPENGTKAIAEITQEVVITGKDGDEPIRKTKFKLHDKRQSLVDVGKHLGMFRQSELQAGHVTINMNFGQAAPVIEGEATVVEQAAPKIGEADKG